MFESLDVPAFPAPELPLYAVTRSDGQPDSEEQGDQLLSGAGYWSPGRTWSWASSTHGSILTHETFNSTNGHTSGSGSATVGVHRVDGMREALHLFMKAAATGWLQGKKQKGHWSP